MWVGYFIVAIILTATAANIYDHECLGSDRLGTEFCNRSWMALVVGGAGSAASIVVIGMKVAAGVAPWGIELLLSGCLFLVNCFDLALVTAEDGPGAKVGNLYYFSWFSLVLSFLIMSGTIDSISKRKKRDQKDSPIDIYEEPATESLNAFPRKKMLSERHPSEAFSVAPTEFSSGVESYSYAQQEGRTENSGQSVADYSRQSFYSQRVNTLADDFQGEEYEGDEPSETGWSSGRESDPANFKKPPMAKGQSLASSLDGTEYGVGKFYAHSTYSDSHGSGGGNWNSEERGVDLYSSAASFRKHSVGSEFDEGGDSYASDFHKQGGGNAYSEVGDSYAASGSSEKRGSLAEEFNGSASFASIMSFQKPWKGADMTTGHNDASASGASVRKHVMSSGQSYASYASFASFADDEDHVMSSGTLV
jgi:hypothetical protein